MFLHGQPRTIQARFALSAILSGEVSPLSAFRANAVCKVTAAAKHPLDVDPPNAASCAGTTGYTRFRARTSAVSPLRAASAPNRLPPGRARPC
jgi:hypothetical protein